ncbi:MAG: adenylate/guanylate cyclase domain-containing protein [Myxococcales bacterium]|jgi:adenylate cyclase
MAFLRIIAPEGNERTVELEPHNTLGRHPDNTVQILDRIVSKNHCHIDSGDQGYVLKDLGSLNGTYVNGERVSGEQVLVAGDEITLGSTKILFDGGAGKPAPAGQGAAKVGRVTMTPGMVESHVRAKLAQQHSQNFMPERLIDDQSVLRRDYEKLRVSFELTRAIAGELDVDRLLAKILETAFELLASDRGVVLLLDDGGELKPACVRTKRGDNSEEVALSTTIINEVVQNRTAVLSSDALMDQRFKGAQSIIMQGIRSSMAVPLIYSDELLGVMVLDSQVAANAFTDKDLQLTQALADQAAVAIQNSLYAQKIEREALTRQRFERLLSPAIADLVVSGEVEVEKGGQSRQTTVFFSDIRGFTAMSERRSAQQIVDMLNEYFELMVEMVFKHEGTLDKFVGDEIMALFGSPVSHPDDAYRAVKVAVEQMHALEEWNLVRVAEGEEPIHVGIGINTGEVVAGYLGSSRALEYTVIGDVVNTASRLCSAAKAGEVLVSASTHEQVKDYFRTEELPPVQVKNKAQPLHVFRVLGERRRR